MSAGEPVMKQKKPTRKKSPDWLPDRHKFRKIYLSPPGGCGRPFLILPPDPDQLDNVQQVIQGIGAIPKLMLPPHPGGHRQEKELVNVRAGQGDPGTGVFPSSFDCPAPKKPERLQAIPSSSNFIQEGVSCSSSGYPHSDPVMTG